MNAKAIFLGGTALVVLCGLTDLGAEELSLTTSTATTITTESGHGRLLLDFPSLASLHDQWVTGATLSIPVESGGLSSDLEIEVDALTRSWSAGASWTSPWTTPGGDLVQTLANAAVLRAGSSGGTLTADVTDIVRAMVEGEIEEHGFIVLPSSSPEAGFGEEELALVGAEAAGATLQVYYRDLKALGYDGGPKALLARKHEARAEEAGHPR